MSYLVAEVAVTVAAADLVSGVVHWAEDAYARPGVPVLGSLAKDNLRHHWKPREFLAKSWIASSWDLLLAAVVVMGLAALIGYFTWHVVLFTALVANANQIHKWTHMNRAEVPLVVHWLQRAYLIQNPRHHGRHHSGARDSHYCVITNFLNPLLEEIRLWSRLEAGILRLTGIARRDEAEESALLGVPVRARRPACAKCELRAAT